MKLTDFALIFVAIFLPVVIIVYVNTSFVVKAEKQEMYYKNLMNSAISDAVSAMKHIENENTDIDYGYSGIVDKKVSINSKTAVDTFYNSLANNFNIANNEVALQRLKMYIPAIAILDYDGIYIHSAEEDEAGNLSFITKPKVYYTYSYILVKNRNPVTSEYEYYIKEVKDTQNVLNENLLSRYIYEVNFTMDDYVYLNIYRIKNDGTISDIEEFANFYINDEENNYNLVYVNTAANVITSSQKDMLRLRVIEHLTDIRARIIAETSMKEISYAVNKHNSYAEQAGITYNFRFSVESDSAWYETMDGIGMIAIIQGISLGNRYLNYKAYSASDLIVAKKYYVSKGVTIEGRDLSYLERDLYHVSNKCPAYLEYANTTSEKVVPAFYSSKAETTTQGYYPCPICKP